MKRTIYFLFVVGLLSGHLSFAHSNSGLIPNRNASINLIENAIFIPENQVKEFSENPLTYIRTHFDIREYIKEVEDNTYIYHCTFRSSKGNMITEFNSDGELKRINIKFSDVSLPVEVRNKIYENYRGYTITNVLYRAYGFDDISREIYKIKLKKGDSVRNVRIKNSKV